MTGLLVAAAVAAAVVLLFVVGGDNKGFTIEDPDPENHRFHVGVEANPFAGPAPLTVKAWVQAFHASGDVYYRWRFDDGTLSEEQDPTHIFAKPGYYQASVSVRDAKGHFTRYHLIFGAWPPKLWAASAQRRATRKEVLQQGRRSVARKRKQRVASLRRALSAQDGASSSETSSSGS